MHRTKGGQEDVMSLLLVPLLFSLLPVVVLLAALAVVAVVDCGDDAANVDKKNDATASLAVVVGVVAVVDAEEDKADDGPSGGGGGMTPSCIYKLPRAGIRIRKLGVGDGSCSSNSCRCGSMMSRISVLLVAAGASR
jgi:hypothetical protein